MTQVSQQYSNSPVKVFWVMTICIDPKEVRSSQTLWGTPAGESASLSGGVPNLVASGSKNPGGVGSNCLCTMAITPELTAPSGSETSSGQ